LGIIDGVLRRIAQRLIVDLNSDSRPRVAALLAGAAQTISIDDPGNEPDITLLEIEENV